MNESRTLTLVRDTDRYAERPALSKALTNRQTS
jgi:hypothetical protein